MSASALIRVGANVQASNLVQSFPPVYPPLARQAHVSGAVRFNVAIGPDGHIANATLVSGHRLLVAAAQEAVVQYVYKPTLLNGQPTAVMTTVDVNFTLDNKIPQGGNETFRMLVRLSAVTTLC